MKARISVKCDGCGVRFGVGNTNGLPNGFSFVQKDNTSITLCQKCIIKIGEMGESEKSDFFTKLKPKNESDD